MPSQCVTPARPETLTQPTKSLTRGLKATDTRRRFLFWNLDLGQCSRTPASSQKRNGKREGWAGPGVQGLLGDLCEGCPAWAAPPLPWQLPHCSLLVATSASPNPLPLANCRGKASSLMSPSSPRWLPLSLTKPFRRRRLRHDSLPEGGTTGDARWSRTKRHTHPPRPRALRQNSSGGANTELQPGALTHTRKVTTR